MEVIINTFKASEKYENHTRVYEIMQNNEDIETLNILLSYDNKHVLIKARYSLYAIPINEIDFLIKQLETVSDYGKFLSSQPTKKLNEEKENEKEKNND